MASADGRPGERIAWLSLDEDDDDVWQFIPYLLQALRPLYADWDADFWRDMEEQKLSSSEQLLAGLINQLHYCPHDVYLIIDDFHVINDRGVYEALGYLIKHAPAALHLIIGSRFHPNLALSQLQARTNWWKSMIETCNSRSKKQNTILAARLRYHSATSMHSGYSP
jgi:LuxR family maltose regulon positive regulatory protein